MAKSAQTTPLEFLRALLEPLKGGLIELRAIPLKGSNRSPMRDWIRTGAELADFAHKYGQKGSAYGVYFGVCKRATKGGKKADVMGATALWADIDCVVNGQNIDGLLKLIGEMPANIQPSAVIHSGGGIHCYWFLSEDATFDYSDKYTVEQIEEANRNLAYLVGGDNVADVTRVLRLPGTFNNKRRPEKECKVVYCAHHMRYHPTSLLRDVSRFGKVIDGDKWVPAKSLVKLAKTQSTHEVSDDKIMRAINALYPSKSKPVLDKFWADRVRYNAPRGYVGIHEAIVYSTAKLHCTKDYTPEQIVEKVVEWIKDVPDLDHSSWDWAAERKKIKYTLETWAPKWKQILADERKLARG